MESDLVTAPQVCAVGTGNIGSTIGRALLNSGFQVKYAFRDLIAEKVQILLQVSMWLSSQVCLQRSQRRKGAEHAAGEHVRRRCHVQSAHIVRPPKRLFADNNPRTSKRDSWPQSCSCKCHALHAREMLTAGPVADQDQPGATTGVALEAVK